jgi:hypothetical protein
MRELSDVAASKPRSQRDTDIVAASHIVVVVLPYPRPKTWTPHRPARGDRRFIYVQGRQETKPAAAKVIPQQPGASAGLSTEAGKIAWAKRRGIADRSAGVACADYRAFCAKHAVPGSPLAQRMWSAYTVPIWAQQTRKQPTNAVRESPSAQRIRPSVPATSPTAAGTKLTAPAAAQQPKPTAATHRGIPQEWYDIAVKTIGAKAEAQENGAAVMVVLTAGGKLLDDFREPRGRKTADHETATFNKEVAVRKLNPPEAQADNWR